MTTPSITCGSFAAWASRMLGADRLNPFNRSYPRKCRAQPSSYAGSDPKIFKGTKTTSVAEADAVHSYTRTRKEQLQRINNASLKNTRLRLP